MVPDDESKAAQPESPAAKRPRRRSRRGGRRHSRRPTSQPEEPASAESVSAKAPLEVAPTQEVEPIEMADEQETSIEKEHDVTAPEVAETIERESFHSGSSHISSKPQQREFEPKSSAIATAVEEVNRVVEELKRALDEMEEVLELLELAERQKIDDEREIEDLKRALRRIHRPREGDRH